MTDRITPSEIQRVQARLTTEFTDRDWEVYQHVWYWSAVDLIKDELRLKGKALHDATWAMWLAFKSEGGWGERDARVLEERGKQKPELTINELIKELDKGEST